VRGGKRKPVDFHTEGLQNVYGAAAAVVVIVLVFCCCDRNNKDECARYLAHPEGMRNVYNIVVGKFEKKRELGRFRLKCEYNIKIDLNEVGCHHST